jgi:hypothetical protein
LHIRDGGQTVGKVKMGGGPYMHAYLNVKMPKGSGHGQCGNCDRVRNEATGRQLIPAYATGDPATSKWCRDALSMEEIKQSEVHEDTDEDDQDEEPKCEKQGEKEACTTECNEVYKQCIEIDAHYFPKPNKRIGKVKECIYDCCMVYKGKLSEAYKSTSIPLWKEVCKVPNENKESNDAEEEKETDQAEADAKKQEETDKNSGTSPPVVEPRQKTDSEKICEEIKTDCKSKSNPSEDDMGIKSCKPSEWKDGLKKRVTDHFCGNKQNEEMKQKCETKINDHDHDRFNWKEKCG